MAENIALVHGPRRPELWKKTLGSLIDEQEARYGDRNALIIPWQSVSLSYRQLAERSRVLAKAILEMGLRHGDCVGIMAGNCYQYIEVFLGSARVGCPVVVLNNTYTPQELRNAVLASSCKLVFVSLTVGTRSLAKHVTALCGEHIPNRTLPELRRVVLLAPHTVVRHGVEVQQYSTFTSNAHSVFMGDAMLKRVERKVSAEHVLNLQFTSGTTGTPKAAMLTHINLINNARFIGGAMKLTPDDIICCPPPLFHCFGLVLGFLASFCHGSSVIFPADCFNVKQTVDCMVQEDATVILGVPTMYIGEMEVIAHTGQRPRRLRTGIIAGTNVSPILVHQIHQCLDVEKMLIAYGMTETSPLTFITRLDDSDEKGATTVGRVLPHTAAKVIDQDGNIVRRGERGELCTSGYALQKGYWRNAAQTRKVMKRDENGVLWMHTGDEAMIDDEGYASITGRIKDIIIRGGENLFPREIEECLESHPSISEASVVGIPDWRYGEAVGCFLRAADAAARPDDQEVIEHVRSTVGRHKTPQHIFWIGDSEVGSDFPKTGSGKHQKHILRDIGRRLMEQNVARGRL
ncbi:hypothetical protein ABOM_004146 [Aspergillus bombycis]|uniref:Long-chain-fatty-acid-CoA ligase n=1 Tax=Aspergillus bombycis TaxID=109264 RepID=A0A1F8ACA0_9EURO|nr:hypothetical protein ABOM_004146 [Aspergillus bombycis]OGM49287.1 hypothetical protein ABOM_004146 [Aspergillus bombycis]